MPSPLGITTSGTRGIMFDYKYNSSFSNTTGSFKKIGKANNVTQSIYNKNKFYYRPSNNGEDMKSNTPRKPHGSNSNGDIYDTSIQSIIDYTSNYKSMKLSEVDFAYLRDLGVYPNNRLMVARRFKSPVEDDLTAVTHQPISTLLSWFDTENPVKVSYNEKWSEGQGSLLDILDKMLNTGGGLSGGKGALDSFFSSGAPLPGFSEGLQFQILKELGWTENGLQNVPSGNPNLIWQSKKRETVGNNGGSGLESSVSINFETVYEQKFIAGNDPTLIYMDIINNALRFGTSESDFYINGKGEKFINDFLKKFRKGEWIDAMSLILNALTDAVDKIITKIKDTGGDVLSGDTDISQLVKDTTETIGGAVFSKYRTDISGIVSSITGSPSTPWHITVGNPKAPIFSSGDMLCEKVSIDLGETLSFNDLPSTIKISFSLTSARSLGLQEIFKKYNTGKGRIYDYIDKSQFEENVNSDNINLNADQNQEDNTNNTNNTIKKNNNVKNVANGTSKPPNLP